MKNITLFILALVVAVGVARADDLLDAVLNTPSAAMKTNTAPAAVPAADARTGTANTPKPTMAESVGAFVSKQHPKGNESADSGHIQNPATLSLRGGKRGGMVVDNGKVEAALLADESVPIADRDAREHIVRPKTFSIRGGIAPSAYSRLVSAEWTQPLNDSPFDVNLRALILYASGTDGDEAGNQGGEALGIFRPLRGETVSPFAGLGLRFEAFFRDEENECDDSASATIVGRIGVLLDLDRAFIVGECIVGSNS